MEINFDRLWKEVISTQNEERLESVDGPSHWRQVEKNGLYLVEKTGANVIVVRLFSIFHDSRRINDYTDPGHGERGAGYARQLRRHLFDLNDEDFALLEYACTWHADQDHHDDPTIGTCWDADRLDLGRVGITPDPALMSTTFGRELASEFFHSEQED